MKKHLKTALGVVLVIATGVIFGLYVHSHPDVTEQLRHLPLKTLLLLLVLYLVWWGALAAILQISLRIYHKKMSFQENILLSAYSSLLNFFGPGQSGPGLRAIYLKKRHRLPIKDYIFATLLYYAFYAIISAGLLFVGSRPWWQTCLLIVLAGGGSLTVLRWYAKRSKIKDGAGLNIVNLGWLFGATALQMLAQCAIYFVELQAVHPHVGVGQVLTYTGAANFALFVALTPGAIGIREAFLVFTQSLHHLSNNAIVAANIIDRGAYLVFLGLLFVLVFGLHAGKKLKWRQMTTEPDENDDQT